MHVHVPQSGDQELAGGVNHVRIWRSRNIGSDRCDAIAGDQDRRVTPDWPTGNIDDGDVRQSDRRLSAIRLCSRPQQDRED